MATVVAALSSRSRLLRAGAVAGIEVADGTEADLAEEVEAVEVVEVAL
jgi:hypothetical protein